MLAGVEEDDGQRGVDLRDHVQEDGGIRAEGRNCGNISGGKMLDGGGHDIFGRQPGEACVQRRRQLGDPARRLKRSWLRCHRAPP
jgi:hypothetical protein